MMSFNVACRCPSELCPPFICPPGRYSPVNSVPLDNIHYVPLGQNSPVKNVPPQWILSPLLKPNLEAPSCSPPLGDMLEMDAMPLVDDSCPKFCHPCTDYNNAQHNRSFQGLIDPRSGERACNSAYACRDGKMLVVTKNRTKRVGGWQRQLCSLRWPSSCRSSRVLWSLAKGFGPIFEGVWAGFRESEGSIFSNHQHFAVSTGICGVACPLPALRVDKPLIFPIMCMFSFKRTLKREG